MASYAERRRDDGYVIVEDAFDPSFIDSVRQEFDRQWADRPDWDSQLSVGHERRMLTVAIEGPLLDPMLYANPHVLEMLDDIFEGDFVLDSLTAVVALPGAQDQQFHADRRTLFPNVAPAFNRVGSFALNVAVPLVDLTPETGTTRLYPGSHGRPMGSLSDESVLPYIRRGGFYAMDYCLWHRGTANLSAAIRPVLFLIYTRPWFIDVDHFKQQARIRLSEDNFERIPAEHRHLFRRLAAKGAFDRTEQELLGDQ